RPQKRFAERIRMNTAPVDLHPQQLLQSDVGQTHVAAKMIQKRELACLVRRLERHTIKTEGPGELVCECAVENSSIVEQADPDSGFSRFYDKLDGTGVQPAIALIDQLLDQPHFK